ncbi:MAG: CarD family transcriptional regulator [Candidatus Onthovivens sp.]|nr:CarD family transcriptional regulator [Candidatus Onthovivens sp.]
MSVVNREKLLIHKVHGLCEIIDQIEMGGNQYYKVRVVGEDGLTLYCPIDKKGELYRDLISKEQAVALFEYMKTIKDVKFDSSKQRRTQFKEMLFSGDPKNIAYILRVLYIYKRYKDDKNQTLGLEDKKMFDYAENLMKDELSVVFNVDKSDIDQLISANLSDL